MCALGLKKWRRPVSIALWLILVLLLLAFLYWLIVVGEGTYLGRAAVRLIYQLGAGVYDQARANVTASDEAVLLPLLSRALAGMPAPHVLDVATGTARVPLLLAAQPWFDGLIDGLDLTSAMLSRAQAKIEAADLAARITLRQGDAGANTPIDGHARCRLRALLAAAWPGCWGSWIWPRLCFANGSQGTMSLLPHESFEDCRL
jgi:hypothetical protein